MRAHVPAAAALLLATVAAPGQSSKPGTLPEELAAAKRAGIPVTMKDLQEPLPAPEKNAAIYYIRLGDVRGRRQQAARDFATIEGPALPNAEQGERIRQALLRNSDICELVRSALNCTECVFPANASQPSTLEARQYVPVRVAVRWLRAESYDLWARGMQADAVARLAQGFGAARHAATARSAMSFLVACSIDSMILDAFDRMLLSPGIDAKTAEAIASAVRKECRDHSPADCAVGDAVQIQFWAMRLKQDGAKSFPQVLRNVAMGSTGSFSKGWSAPRDWPGFVNAAVAYALWMARREMAAVTQPYPQAIRSTDALGAEVRRRLRHKDPVALLVAATWSTTRQPAQSLARSQARRSVTLALAAVVAWRLAHGDWPSRLSDAAAPPPRDPFDLRPLRYARLKDGFAIWSVGPAGRFDASRLRGEAPVGEVGIRWPRSSQ